MHREQLSDHMPRPSSQGSLPHTAVAFTLAVVLAAALERVRLRAGFAAPLVKPGPLVVPPSSRSMQTPWAATSPLRPRPRLPSLRTFSVPTNGVSVGGIALPQRSHSYSCFTT